MVLLDTGTPGTSREIFSEDADDDKQVQLHLKQVQLHFMEVTTNSRNIPFIDSESDEGAGGETVTSIRILNDTGMVACGFLGILVTRKVLDSLSEVSRD